MGWHGLFTNVSVKEWADLKNGPGAGRFFDATGLSRNEITSYLQESFGKLQRDNNLTVVKATGAERKVRYQKLSLPLKSTNSIGTTL